MYRAGEKGERREARAESTADFKTDRPVTLLWRPQPVRMLQGEGMGQKKGEKGRVDKKKRGE